MRISRSCLVQRCGCEYNFANIFKFQADCRIFVWKASKIKVHNRYEKSGASGYELRIFRFPAVHPETINFPTESSTKLNLLIVSIRKSRSWTFAFSLDFPHPSPVYILCWTDRENIIKIITYTQMKISIYSSGLNRNRKSVGKYMPICKKGTNTKCHTHEFVYSFLLFQIDIRTFRW